MAKILVIDDSSFQRKWLAKAVHTLGHETIEASNGKDGLDQLEQEQPACITVDLNMPEMDGVEFLREMKTRNLRIPAIVVTADIQSATRSECLDLGAVAFLNKPFKPEKLEEALEECFQIAKGASK